MIRYHDNNTRRYARTLLEAFPNSPEAAAWRSGPYKRRGALAKALQKLFGGLAWGFGASLAIAAFVAPAIFPAVWRTLFGGD